MRILRTTLAGFVAAALGCGLAACGSLQSNGEATGAKVVSAEALARVNAFRAENGAPPLELDRHASAAALRQATAMANHQEMRHNIGFGADFARRMKQDGVPLPAAENIASGQRTLDAAITAWEKSPPHRRNMLTKAYRGVGVAVATDAKTGRNYWSMDLTGG